MNHAKIPTLPNYTVLVFSLLFFGAASVYLGQDVNWDLRNYHYYNPYAFLNGRLGFDFGAGQVQTYLNPILDLPFYFFVNHFPPVCVGFFLGALHGVNFWLLFIISYYSLSVLKFGKGLFLSLLSAAVGMYGPANLSLLGTTFNDNFTSIFVLGSVLILIRTLMLQQELAPSTFRKRLIYAGVILGLGTGLKLTLMAYLAGFAMAVIALPASMKERLFRFGICGIGLFLGIMGSAGFWMWRLWKLFDSPLFPFYNKLFGSPYFELINFNSPYFFPKNWMQQFFYPFYFSTYQNTVMELNFRDIRLGLIYCLLLLFLWIKFRTYVFPRVLHDSPGNIITFDNSRKRLSAFLISFFVGSYIIWQILFSVYRYLVPLELLSPVLIILFLSDLIPLQNKRTIAILILFSAIVFFVKSPNWGRLPWGDTFFGTKVPAIENPSNSIVVMANDEPISYVIPAFPSTIRFVRVFSNFTDPNLKNKMQSDIRELLKNHTGHLYLLTKKSKLDADNKVLGSYRLHVGNEEGRTIISRLDQDLVLYRLDREGR